MPYPKGMHPGAVWKRTDLQVHTPRDPQWSSGNFVGGTPEREAAREVWADSFVSACVSKQLDVVAKVIALAPGVADGGTGTGPANRITVEVDGAIESPEVRDLISDTLEGGRDAFELRGRKYLFTKN